ncbi:TadE/TadG family type IV pilus assembly protein [Ornithinimicrobium sp. W1679]|uniref:TadE/TadG family type IV pilus assembly protein n=1 Tax=Ornithinimicrobium sp. W1679 TaxID=3418770 RepID=UPI003CF083E0
MGHRDLGAAAIEFALVALLLVTMVLGAIDFGHAWGVQASLAQATRDAAREMAIKDDSVAAEVRFYSSFQPFGSSAAPATATVSFSRTGVPGDDDCRDTAESSFVSPTLTGFFSESFTLGARGVMRCGG